MEKFVIQSTKMKMLLFTLKVDKRLILLILTNIVLIKWKYIVKWMMKKVQVQVENVTKVEVLTSVEV